MHHLLIDTTQNQLLLSLLNTQTGELVSPAPNEQEARQVSQYFFSQLQALCLLATIDVNQISGIAINTGPGSFTGIRVGLTVARVLATFQKSITTIRVFNTFELIAATPMLRNQETCILLNAYRARHYRALLKIDAAAIVTYQETPTIINNADTNLMLTSSANNISVVETSLMPLLNISPIKVGYRDVVKQLADAMAFLVLADLKRNESLYDVSFDQLLPNYMQQPHITQKKDKPGAVSP